ncbi:MAG TPA: PEP-utilizing enzyme [Dehalococcoidia bacterium]|nr:PEP-utilizing enzyme [Dehalococcoidia bacterium]
MAPTVKYELPDPDYEQYTWAWENEHTPGSQPPLTREMFKGMLPPPSEGPPLQIAVHGYRYFRADATSGRPMPPAPDDGLSALQRWEEEWLPRVNDLELELREFNPSSVPPGEWESTLEAQSEKFGKVFAGVHLQTVMPSGQLAEEFVEKYVGIFGEARRQDALALLSGFDNQTFDRATQMWQLSRLIEDAPSLREFLDRPGVLDGPEIDVESIFDAGLFGEGFRDFLEEWGSTMDMFVQDFPSWRENPATALALIRHEADQPEDESPLAAEQARRKRRQELEHELEAAAANSADAAAVLDALRDAQELLPVRENHNFLCDQRLSAASRYRWLHIGEHLVDAGKLSRTDDVFYLQHSELVAALETTTTPEAATIQERRDLQAAIRATPPPVTLGKTLEDASAAAGGERDQIQISGVAASPGQFRGRARVARSIDEAATLTEEGILVCVVTAPAWTPVFGVVGAVVTDAGGALSHPAIVAREYGIPAVVGTRTATSRIPNGVMITVDGTSGTVTVEPG